MKTINLLDNFKLGLVSYEEVKSAFDNLLHSELEKVRQERKCIHGEQCIECLGELGRKGMLPK